MFIAFSTQSELMEVGAVRTRMTLKAVALAQQPGPQPLSLGAVHTRVPAQLPVLPPAAPRPLHVVPSAAQPAMPGRQRLVPQRSQHPREQPHRWARDRAGTSRHHWVCAATLAGRAHAGDAHNAGHKLHQSTASSCKASCLRGYTD
eukprot:6213282-Pleurochrysis_carterae.AAC.2